MQACLEAGHQVFCSADEREHEATAQLRKRGVGCVRLAPNDPGFSEFLQGLQPRVVVFDRFTTEEKFSWRVRETCPDSVRVLDTIDLHGLRLARAMAHQAHPGAVPAPLGWLELLDLAGDTARREIAAIYRSDLSLLTSDAEMRLLTQEAEVPERLLHLCRLTYPELNSQLPFAARQGYSCIGNFRHPPNVDAMQWLKAEVWPLIRRLHPEGQVHIWGAHAKPHHLAWNEPKLGFHVHGYAEDPGVVLAGSRVNLAPLRFGAGIKGKIADGWWWGVPAVTTWVGAEGMHEQWPFGGIIADTAADLAQEAVRLYHDESLWEAAAASGSRILRHLYLPEATTQAFLGRLEQLLHGQTEARARNLTGQMLWQQGLRSTEYFSRWIEAKRLHGQQGAKRDTKLDGPSSTF